MIRLHGTITALDEVVEQVFLSGFGADAKFERRHIGFKLQIDLLVSFFIEGDQKPDFVVGDHVALTIIKEPLCLDVTPLPNPNSHRTHTTSGDAPTVSSGMIPSTKSVSSVKSPIPQK